MNYNCNMIHHGTNPSHGSVSLKWCPLYCQYPLVNRLIGRWIVDGRSYVVEGAPLQDEACHYQHTLSISANPTLPSPCMCVCGGLSLLC